jgi:hypothetical protein
MSPLLLAAAATPLYILAGAIDATSGQDWFLGILRYTGGLSHVYAYALWLVTRQELNVSTTRKRVATACALVGALAFIQGPGHNVPETPVWAYFVAPLALAIFVSPFVIAVSALRAREDATDQSIPIGAITAFVWFFAGPIGLYFLHKRFLSTRDHEDQVVRPPKNVTGER